MAMRTAKLVMTATVSCGVGLFPLQVHGQGMPEDYRRAEGLRARLEASAAYLSGPAVWVDSGGQFWYRRSVKGTNEYVLVDARSGRRRPAFDPQRLATALSAATRRTYTQASLPVNALRVVDGARAVEIVVDSTRWRCAIE